MNLVELLTHDRLIAFALGVLLSFFLRPIHKQLALLALITLLYFLVIYWANVKSIYSKLEVVASPSAGAKVRESRESVPRRYIVTSTTLNGYDEPANSGKNITILKKNDVLVLHELKSEWARVSKPADPEEMSFWVEAKFLGSSGKQTETDIWNRLNSEVKKIKPD